jgi:hypothetical protein
VKMTDEFDVITEVTFDPETDTIINWNYELHA